MNSWIVRGRDEAGSRSSRDSRCRLSGVKSVARAAADYPVTRPRSAAKEERKAAAASLIAVRLQRRMSTVGRRLRAQCCCSTKNARTTAAQLQLLLALTSHIGLLGRPDSSAA